MTNLVKGYVYLDRSHDHFYPLRKAAATLKRVHAALWPQKPSAAEDLVIQRDTLGLRVDRMSVPGVSVARAGQQTRS